MDLTSTSGANSRNGLPADADAALVLTTPQGLDEIRNMDRVQGALDEPYEGILYVPVLPAAR